ncbi:hypothetical protein C5167_049665 [Papaver somniferum]|uniref:Uncharacterized protein n=1 Tax=Papaver somniferum TaxID=3469 RepID=A0A4Y7KQG1_PAPSO|nr:hypothetical protein C5167_049665 [Papaver somniferum]
MSVERSFEAWEEVQRQGHDLADRLAQAIFDAGNRLGQAGVEFGASVNGVNEQFFRRLPVPFRHDESDGGGSLRVDFDTQRRDAVLAGHKEDLKSLAEQFRDYGFSETSEVVSDESAEEDGFGGKL